MIRIDPGRKNIEYINSSPRIDYSNAPSKLEQFSTNGIDISCERGCLRLDNKIINARYLKSLNIAMPSKNSCSVSFILFVLIYEKSVVFLKVFHTPKPDQLHKLNSKLPKLFRFQTRRMSCWSIPFL